MDYRETLEFLKTFELRELINLWLEAKSKRLSSVDLIEELPLIDGVDTLRLLETSINELLESLDNR